MANQQPVANKQSRSRRDKQQKADPDKGQNGHEEEIARYEKELAGYLQERIKPGLNRGAIPLLARSIAKEIAHREHPNGPSAGAEVKNEASDETDDQASAEAGDEGDDRASAEAEDEGDDRASAEADDQTSSEAEDEADDQAGSEAEDEADDQASAEAEDEADDQAGAEAEDEPSAGGEAPQDFEGDMHEFQAELGEDWTVSFSVHGDDGWLTAEKDDGSQHLEAQTAPALREAIELLNEDGGRST